MSEQNSVFIFKEETDISLDNNIQSNHIEDNVTNKSNNIIPESSDVNTVNTFEIKTENDYRNIVIQKSMFVKDEIDIIQERFTYVNNYDNNETCNTENVTVTSNIANNITIDPLNVCAEIKLEKDDSDIKEEIPSFHTEVREKMSEQNSVFIFKEETDISLDNNIQSNHIEDNVTNKSNNIIPESSDVNTVNTFEIKTENDYRNIIIQKSMFVKDEIDIIQERFTYVNNYDNNETCNTENVTVTSNIANNITIDPLNVCAEIKLEKDDSDIKEEIPSFHTEVREKMSEQNSVFIFKEETDISLDNNIQSNHIEDNVTNKSNNIIPESSDVNTVNTFEIKTENDYRNIIIQKSMFVKDDIDIIQERFTYVNNYDNNETCHTENVTVTSNIANNITIDPLNVCAEIKLEKDDSDIKEEIPSFHTEVLFNKIEQMSQNRTNECGDMSTGNVFEIKTETDYENTVAQNSNLKKDRYIVKEEIEIKEEIITYRNDDDNNESYHAEKSNVNSFKNLHGKQIECEKPHNCKICQKSFSRNELFRRHLITHTGTKPFKCNLCKKSFSQKGNIKIHMMTHTGEKPYECNICKKTFQQRGHLKSHAITHTDIKPFQCDLCKKSFSLKHNFNRHMFTHIDVKPYECNICKKSFTQKGQLNSHMFTHTDIKPFKCDLCKKSFSLEHSFKKHLISHTVVQLHKCNTCKKSFSRNGVLRRHMITHTDMKPYKCDLCKKSFSQKGSIIIHMATHTDEKPFECKICKKSFSRNEVLRRHMFTHTDIKPHKCDICQKSFTQILQLKSHMSTHNGIKPFKCTLCKKSFSLEHGLKQHLISHTDVQPYKCKICQKSFSRNEVLKRHMFTHTNVKPHKFVNL